MANLRNFRVRELLKREIGEILRRELPVDSCGLVSVNDVIVSNDLKSATVFISILGTPQQKNATQKQLIPLRSIVRGQLGRNVVLKFTPRVRFLLDDSIAKGDRVLQLLDEIEKTLPTPPQEE